MSRGYFGIGVYHPKTEPNIGTLMRHARLYDAAFVFTVGHRYRRFATDTANTTLHVPLYEYEDFEQLFRHLPTGSPLVGIELDPRATPLGEYVHPLRATYLLGAEDNGLPAKVIDRCHHLIQIPTPRPQSMNVAVAGTLVMHDRYTSMVARAAEHERIRHA